MTDKEKIRAEFEYRIGVCNIIVETKENELDKALFVGRVLAYEDVLSFIDSLPEEPKIDAPYEIRFDPANGSDLGSVNVYRDGNLVVQRPEQWKWIDPKYEYPLCLTREMDECGDWHYSLSSGKISETCQYISLAELERLPDEPVDADAAMKELDEKIKLTKEHGSWKGVDVDKFMDEVRGRESDDLEEEFEKYLSENIEFDRAGSAMDKWNKGCHLNRNDLEDIAHHFAEWQRKQDQGTIELAEDHAMLAGMNKEREELMKEAVEAEVVKDISNKLAVTAKINLAGFKFGQKVKIIILKDDER